MKQSISYVFVSMILWCCMLMYMGCNLPNETVDQADIEHFVNSKQQEKYYVPNFEYVFRSVVDRPNKKVVEITVVYDEQGVATITSDIVSMEDDDVNVFNQDVVTFKMLNSADDIHMELNKFEMEYRILSNQDKLWLIPFEFPYCILNNVSKATFAIEWITSKSGQIIPSIATVYGYDKNIDSHACLSNEENKRNMSEIVTSSDLVTGGAILIKAEDVVFRH